MIALEEPKKITMSAHHVRHVVLYMALISVSHTYSVSDAFSVSNGSNSCGAHRCRSSASFPSPKPGLGIRNTPSNRGYCSARTSTTPDSYDPMEDETLGFHSSARGTSSTSSKRRWGRGGSKKKPLVSSQLQMSSISAVPTISSNDQKKARRRTKRQGTKPKNDPYRSERKVTNRPLEEYLQEEMFNHDILTKDEEFELGSKIVRAANLRESARIVVDDNVFSLQEDQESDYFNALMGYPKNGQDGTLEDLEYLSVYGIDTFSGGGQDMSEYELSFESENDVTLHTQHRKNHDLQQAFSKPSSSNDLPIEDVIRMLSDEDIQYGLDLPGGRQELQQILVEGALARDKMMRHNIKLVLKIVNAWFGRSWGGTSKRYNKSSYTNIYRGAESLPTFDEALQEGIIGLATAVDKFEPQRGLKFSTFATHWVTNYIRRCFQAAVTGVLVIPPQLHDIKNKYKKITDRVRKSGNGSPTEEEIATEIGCTVPRLKTALRCTQSIISIDAPIYEGSSKGSGSGGGNMGEEGRALMDTLECHDLAPEDHVERSFLRQSLENAMAVELSPHERDVLRLRLGLDDGRVRTIKELVEVCGGSVSDTDIRRAERVAFRKLRSTQSLHTHNLHTYLDFAGIDMSTSTMS